MDLVSKKTENYIIKADDPLFGVLTERTSWSLLNTNIHSTTH